MLAAIADLDGAPRRGAAELAAAKARVETELLARPLVEPRPLGALGEFEIATGDFRRAFARADELARVTSADVQRVATELPRGAARGRS